MEAELLRDESVAEIFRDTETGRSVQGVKRAVKANRFVKIREDYGYSSN